MIKTCTVRELIKALNQERLLDKKVLLSRDEEGNGFGTINTEQSISPEGDYVIFYPFEERIDVDF
jgi:hypothetical protein